MKRTTNASPKIVCQNLWKVFGNAPQKGLELAQQGVSREQILQQTQQVVAVRDVSFAVAAGQIFVVMGLSGSGKSTLVRCLTRLIEPTAGDIRVNGVSVVQMDEAALRDLRRHTVSMVFQRFGLFPHRRVIDNVAYGLEVQGVGKAARLAEASKVLELVGLAEWASYFPHELSGGMQQRVGLARALAVDPEILLCDEPFSALDPLIRREMQDELLRLQSSLHKTIIFITHDFLEALRLGDQIVIMRDGRIVQQGTPEEIVANPVDDYVRAFTKDAPRAKVLTAQTVMRAAKNGEVTAAKAVLPTTSLTELIRRTAVSANPLPVVDETGEMLGVVDKASVLLALGE